MGKPLFYSKLIFFSSLTGIVCIVLFFCSLYFGSNPLNNGNLSKMRLAPFFPEWWSFFTKASKDPLLHLVDCNSNTPQLINMKNLTSDYYFGLSRKNRIYSIELSNIVQKATADSLLPLVVKAKNIMVLLHDSINTATINFKNLKVQRQKCPDYQGKYLIILETRLPWSILQKTNNYPKQFSILPVNIEVYE